MNRSTIFEIVSAAIFCVLGFLLIDPTGFWMPPMAYQSAVALSAIALGAFVVFVLRESAEDERDEEHRALAGRAAFLAGAAVLIAGIVQQSATHSIDNWLIGALIAMVLGKVAVRIWSTWYR